MQVFWVGGDWDANVRRGEIGRVLHFFEYQGLSTMY